MAEGRCGSGAKSSSRSKTKPGTVRAMGPPDPGGPSLPPPGPEAAEPIPSGAPTTSVSPGPTIWSLESSLVFALAPLQLRGTPVRRAPCVAGLGSKDLRVPAEDGGSPALARVPGQNRTIGSGLLGSSVTIPRIEPHAMTPTIAPCVARDTSAPAPSRESSRCRRPQTLSNMFKTVIDGRHAVNTPRRTATFCRTV